MTDIGLTEMVVTIVGVSDDGTEIMVRDSLGVDTQIDGSVRPKAMGMPLPGERWIMVKRAGIWTLASMIGSFVYPTITGDRADMDPATIQILDALIFHGLVIDQTAPIVPDEEVLEPPPVITEDEQDTHDESPPDEGDDPDPSTHNPGHDDTPGPDPSDRWQPLWICSFNVFHNHSNTLIRKDIKVVTNSAAGVICLQEMNMGDRTVLLTELDPNVWGYRRSTDANKDELAVLWRKDDYSHIDNGWIEISPAGPPGAKLPSKNIQWVRLRHRASHQDFTVLNVHLYAHVEGHGGNPQRDDPARLAEFESQVRQLADTMQTYAKKGPVFTCGDFNVNWRADVKTRYRGFPIANLHPIGARCNFDILGPTERGTHGNRLIDYVWKVSDEANMVRFERQQVLTGVRSDHHPVLVKAMLRRRGR